MLKALINTEQKNKSEFSILFKFNVNLKSIILCCEIKINASSDTRFISLLVYFKKSSRNKHLENADGLLRGCSPKKLTIVYFSKL